MFTDREREGGGRRGRERERERERKLDTLTFSLTLQIVNGKSGIMYTCNSVRFWRKTANQVNTIILVI